MLGDNIRQLRKNKGLTQEELAIRLNVVRQTLSKWEKGLSVPDAEMLQKIAEILQVDVKQLLGENVEAKPEPNEIVEQLTRINEQMAVRNQRSHRIWKTIGVVLLAVLLINVLLILFGSTVFTQIKTPVVSSVVAVEQEIVS